MPVSTAATVEPSTSPVASEVTTAGVIARLRTPMPSHGLRGWIGPIIVMVIGGILRLWDLGRPFGIAFDETYYPKDALSLLRFGYERGMVDKANEILLASNGDWRVLDIFKPDAAFVVHPPLGKWTIALGEYFVGATPTGWRISVAILGTLAVLITARITRRLTRSDLIGTLAGLFLAIDGIHLVLSRTGLLDLTLGFFVLCAFGFILLDRDRTRARLADIVSRDGLAATATQWGPRLGYRPLRWAAALSLGAACAVKWSAMWFILFLVILTLLWDVSARRVVGVERPWAATLVRDAVPTALSFLGIAVVVYIATWTGWFLSDAAWDRTWLPGTGPINALQNLWHYHAEAWNFHVHLSSPHSYASNPLSWPFQARPTSFFWESIKDHSKGCPTNNCAQEVLALGNPVIWWAGFFAMIHQAWRWIARRDWRSGAVLGAIAAGWLPWMLYLNRTIFTFYTVIYVPFLVMALAMTCGTILGPSNASESRRRWGAIGVGSLVLAAILAAWWFYPIWTGQVIPYEDWHLRMWLPTWV